MSESLFLSGGLRFRWSLGFPLFELIFPELELVACILPSSGWALPAGADVTVCVCGDAAAFNPFLYMSLEYRYLVAVGQNRLGLVDLGMLGIWIN